MNRLPLSKAVRAMLETATGKPWGLAAPPKVNGAVAPLPYGLLYPIPGGAGWTGSLADAHEQVEWVYQTTVVASGPDEAEWLHDKVRDAFVGRTGGGWTWAITVSGLRVAARRVDVEPSIEPGDGTVSGVARYALLVMGGGQ